MDNFATILNDIRSMEDRGGVFEKIFCKWFLENDQYWKTQVKQVWLWKDWPRRWGPDNGIDLIFEHKKGQIWSVQAKCRAETDYIPTKEIESFLSESANPLIDKCLLIATTDKLSDNIKAKMNRFEKPVITYLLSAFRNAGLIYPESLDQLASPPKIIRQEIRPYQQEAVDAVVEKFKAHGRGQLSWPVGRAKPWSLSGSRRK